MKRAPKPTAKASISAAVPHDDWLFQRLRDPELATHYLNAALSSGDQAAFMLALRNVAKARGGVSSVARQTGLNRVSLTRALSEKGNPELKSLTKVLDATGFKLVIASRSKKVQRSAVRRTMTEKQAA